MNKTCKDLSLYTKGKYGSFDELNADYGSDRSQLTEAEHKAYILYCYDLYEATGFIPRFDSHYESEEKHNGMSFTVIGRVELDDKDWDLENLPAWHIRFIENGEEYTAYPEDICMEEHKFGYLLPLENKDIN